MKSRLIELRHPRKLWTSGVRVAAPESGEWFIHLTNLTLHHRLYYYRLCIIITMETNSILTPIPNSGYLILALNSNTRLIFMICWINLWITHILFIVERIIPLLIDTKSFSWIFNLIKWFLTATSGTKPIILSAGHVYILLHQREKWGSTIEYGYRKWGTHARVLKQTLAHGNSKPEIRQWDRRRR